MSPMQTIAPRELRSLAVARPIPEAPPVMAITLPCIDMMVFGYLFFGGDVVMVTWRLVLFGNEQSIMYCDSTFSVDEG